MSKETQIENIKFPIDRGYISFQDEQENNTFYIRAYPKYTKWFVL